MSSNEKDSVTGIMLDDGKDTVVWQPDIKKADATPVAQPKSKESLFRQALSEYRNKQYDSSFKVFKHLAEQNHLESEYMVGIMYAGNYGFKDIEKGKYWLKRAASKGHREAAYQYACILLSIAKKSRTGEEKDDLLYFLGLSAEKGSKSAQNKILELVNNPDYKYDYELKKLAVKCYNRLADSCKDSYDADKYRSLAKKFQSEVKTREAEQTRSKAKRITRRLAIVIGLLMTIVGTLANIFWFGFSRQNSGFQLIFFNVILGGKLGIDYTSFEDSFKTWTLTNYNLLLFGGFLLYFIGAALAVYGCCEYHHGFEKAYLYLVGWIVLFIYPLYICFGAVGAVISIIVFSLIFYIAGVIGANISAEGLEILNPFVKKKRYNKADRNDTKTPGVNIYHIFVGIGLLISVIAMTSISDGPLNRIYDLFLGGFSGFFYQLYFFYGFGPIFYLLIMIAWILGHLYEFKTVSGLSPAEFPIKLLGLLSIPLLLSGEEYVVMVLFVIGLFVVNYIAFFIARFFKKFRV